MKDKQKNKKHVLTEKEKKRIARLEVITAELEEKGFVRKDQSISLVFANIMAIVLGLPFLLLFGVLYFKVGNGITFTIPGYLAWLVLFLILIPVHELIHGITWGICAPSHFKTIEYGYIKEYMTPYCTCGEPLSKPAYLLGSFMPCLLLGIVPCVVSLFCGSFFLWGIGITMIFAAGGDLTVILKMLLYKADASEVIFMDHPSECGYIVFEKF